MGHRQDLNTLSAADRQALVDLMLTYLNDDVVDDHMAIVHSGVEIFTGHRAYIAAMEGWLQSHGGAAFVPLPYWNSANPIPPEFDVVKPADDGTPRPPLMNLNPNMPKPAQYEWPAVCTYEDPADLGDAINGWHGSVHCAIGGSMCMIAIASAAPIFWCWHAFVDHIYWDWQRCTVICPDLVGSPLTWARHQLRLAGLTVGTVTRLPRVVFPGELPPFRMPIPLPDPPPFVHSLPERQLLPQGAVVGASAGHVHGSATPIFVEGGPRHGGGGPGGGGHSHGGGGSGNGHGSHDGVGNSLREWRLHMRPRPDLLRGPRVVDQWPAAGISVRHGGSVDLTVVTS